MVPAESPAVVTTVIPKFRRPRLLKRAIRSALNQTRSELIVSVFDNASGDETPHVIADFMKRDSRVRYFRQPENIGAFRNFEYGMRQVSTPYFSFLSDDDLLVPGLYQEAIEALERESSAMFFCSGDNLREFPREFQGAGVTRLGRGSVSSAGWAICYMSCSGDPILDQRCLPARSRFAGVASGS